jgi:hypothetical protein
VAVRALSGAEAGYEAGSAVEAGSARMLVVRGLAPAAQQPGPDNILDGPSRLASSDILPPAPLATWRLARHLAFPESVGAQSPVAPSSSALGLEAPVLEADAASEHVNRDCWVAEREWARSKAQSVGKSTPAR